MPHPGGTAAVSARHAFRIPARLVQRLELPALEIEDEAGIVVGTEVRPETRWSLLMSAVGERGGMEGDDRGIAWAVEAKMESRSGRMRVGTEEDSKLVIAAGRPIAKPFRRGPQTNPADRFHDRIVEAPGSLQIPHPDGE